MIGVGSYGINVARGRLRRALDLLFVGTETLDPRITFSRTSNATLTDSTGTIAYAPHNLLTQSESFDNAVWQRFGTTTVSPNTTVAPDGTTTADSVTIPVSSGIFQIVSGTAGFTYVFSVYIRAAAPTTVRLVVNTNLSDPVTQTINVTTQWQRFSLSKTMASGTTTVTSQLDTGGGATFFVWGAQLNVSTLQPYNPTTVRNLLGFTQEMSNAAWTKTNSTVTANATAAPDGSVTADTFTGAAGTSIKRIRQNVTTTALGPWTYSIWLKNDTAASALVALLDSSVGGVNNVRTMLTFATGSVSTAVAAGTATGASASVTPFGNGWYRVSITGTFVTALTSVWAEVWLDGFTSTANATSFYIWGAQLSDSASLDPYVYNPAAAPSSTAYYGPRFDYDPVTLAARGLLIEEQRTNSIRNNTMVGAVAGTPGTLPTNWGNNSIGLTRTIVGTGLEGGITYIDVRFNGTTTSQFGNISFETTNGVSASPAQSWTNSAYIKLVAGSFANIALAGIGLFYRDSAALFLSSLAVGSTFSSALTRYSATGTTPANTAFVQPVIFFNAVNASGDAVDFTLRIGLPQLELGAFSTSVIPTTTAAATRAADVATMVGDNFGNWYSQSEGTLYGEFSTGAFAGTLDGGGTARGVACVSDGTANNRIRFGALLSSFIVASGGSTVANILVGSPAANTIYKLAGGYKQDSFQFANSGALGTEDTSGAVPVGVNAIRLGTSLPDGGFLNSHIRRISFFPRRLTNSELQAVTA